ncbi:MAG: hypothetical protein IT442_16725 [Phycisphaeraceae bacterium]|nr:hypothetical protein [Phycisphaeraceae bacterium]
MTTAEHKTRPRRSWWALHRFESVAAHALGHRRLAAAVVRQLSERAWAAKEMPYLTHCHLAKTRGRKHRNTSRAIVRELADLGLIRLYPCRGGAPDHGFEPYKFLPNMQAINAYIEEHAEAANSFKARPGGEGVSTKAQWDAMLVEFRAKRAEEAAQAEADRVRREAEARRQADDLAKRNAVSPSQGRIHLLRLLIADPANPKLQWVMAWHRIQPDWLKSMSAEGIDAILTARTT